MDAKGNAYLAVAGSLYDDEASGEDRETKALYFALYDAKTSEKKLVSVLNETKTESPSDIRMRVLEDKNLYIIVKEKNVFQVNANTLQTKDVTPEYVKGNNELSVGFAKIEFVYNDYGSGFNVVTNDGRNLVFMPFINKVYDQDQFYDAKNSKLPQPTEKTFFAFSTKSSTYPNEKLELVKYKFNYQMGYPREDPRFEWRNGYGGSGVFTDRDPYTKYFARKGDGRLNSFIDLTPGRTYFYPKMLAFNDTEVLIAVKPTPSETDEYQLQILNPKNGTIVKTFNVPTKRISEPSYILKDGYLVEGESIYYLDKTGKMINTIQGSYNLKLNELK